MICCLREGLAEERVVQEINLADGEVVGGAPVRVDVFQFLGRERAGGLVFGHGFPSFCRLWHGDCYWLISAARRPGVPGCGDTFVWPVRAVFAFPAVCCLFSVRVRYLKFVLI